MPEYARAYALTAWHLIGRLRWHILGAVAAAVAIWSLTAAPNGIGRPQDTGRPTGRPGGQSGQQFGVNNAGGWGRPGARLAARLGIGSDRVAARFGRRHNQRLVDAAVAADVRARLRPLIVFVSYRRLSAIHTHTLVSWMVSMARRYIAGGPFWTAHAGLDQSYAPRCFEVQNEPYGVWFYKHIEPAIYARQFVETARAGHHEAPGSCWLLAGGPDVTLKGNGHIVPWDSQMLRAQPDVAQYADGVTVHPYGPTPGDPRWNAHPAQSWGLLAQVHRDFPQLPVWITELGYTSANNGDGLAHSERLKARKATWYVRQTKGLSWVKAFYWTTLVNDSGNRVDPLSNYGLMSWDRHLGLRDALPAYAAYRRALASG